MKREDIIKKMRMIAHIDPMDEAGAMMGDEDALAEIAALADENDRLETELMQARQRYADAFFTNPDPDPEPDPEPEDEEITLEDIMNL